MGLFRPNYDRPGPGVRKDEPRKKGFPRLLEILGRDMSSLVKLNILFCFCILPTGAAFISGMSGILPTIMFLLSLVAAFPVGGALVAVTFCISKMLRDDPGFVWHDFKRKFKENLLQAAFPGILFVAMIYSQVLMWLSQLLGGNGADFTWALAMFIIFIIFSMVAPYVFILFGYIDLKATKIIKNSILLSLANTPRSFMGAITGGFLWIVFVLFLPVSILFLPVIVLFGFTLTMLFTLTWIWPRIDKQFAIEETIRKRQAGIVDEPEGIPDNTESIPEQIEE